MNNTITTIDLQKAVELLHAGKLVAFPTETVYGLGADAANPEAVKKIFTAKGRPATHPVIVHLENQEQLSAWACKISPLAWQLAQKFWPGPMTLVLERAPHVSDTITGGQNTIAVRVPNHPIAQKLLHGFGSGIAAPSANRFGRISPTCAQHVSQELGSAVDLILDGGACTLGIESTIIDLSSATPQILRPGSISPFQINSVLGEQTLSQGNPFIRPRVPGNLLAHYAPQTLLQIVPETKLKPAIDNALLTQQSIAVLTPMAAFIQDTHVHWYSMPVEPVKYAHDLYARLREVDQGEHTLILVTEVPETEEWFAVADRLAKASTQGTR